MKMQNENSFDLLRIIASVLGWACLAASISSLAISEWISSTDRQIGLFQRCDVTLGNCSAIPGTIG